MKFQKLTIHNIASIEDAVINFEAEPLSSCEVFLITGKTGAGKSTILDAVCLALFDSTPRLNNTKMEGETKDVDNNIRIKDVRQLMRRNTAEAFVKLTFTGSNAVHYEATWAVARARKKVGGNIQKRDWQLKNLDTDHTLTKIKEIESEVNKAIGLDFNQFCRTTMLAQGEFTRFLNSNDNDKAAILEKITGVDIYSKVGAKIYETTAQKKQDWNDAQHVVEGVKTLSDEEIANRKILQAELDKKQKEAKEQKDKLAAKQEWIKADAELASSVAKASDELGQAKAVVASEDFVKKETVINDWNATIEARQWLSDAEGAEKEIWKQQNAIDNLEDCFATVLGCQECSQKETADISSKISSINKFLETEKGKVAVYENFQTITSLLTTIDNGRRDISKGREDIENNSKYLAEELIPVYEKTSKDAAEAKEELQHQEATAMEQEDAVNKLNLTELRKQREKGKDLLAKIAKAKERIEELADAKAKKEETGKYLKDRLNVINEKKKTADDMKIHIHDAKLKMDIRKEDLEKQRDTINKFAKTLRMKLHIGDTCPVCRQKILREIPHEEELAALVCDLQQNYDKAEKDYNGLVNSKNKLDSDINALSETYEREQKAFIDDTSVDKATRRTVEACKDCGIYSLDNNTLSMLDSTEVSTKKQQELLDARINEGEKMEKTAKALHNTVEALRKNAETLNRKVKDAETAVNDSNGKINMTKAVIKSKAKDVDNAEKAVNKLIDNKVWDIDWHESPKIFCEMLKTAAATYKKNIDTRQELSVKLSISQALCLNIGSVIKNIIEAMPSWNGIKPNVTANIDSPLETANNINNNLTVALTKLKGAENNRNANMAKLKKFTEAKGHIDMARLKALGTYSASDINRYSEETKKEHDNVVAKQTLLSKAKDQLNKHQETKPELAEEDTLEKLSITIAQHEQEIAAVAEQKGGISQELKADEENKTRLGTLIKEADEKKRIYQKWSRLDQLLGDATGSKFRKIAQSYVLTSLIYSANSYMKTLSDRYTLKVVPGTFVISLEDAYQGYVSRAASTISGGESFLVSLSLALALSDIGQQWQVDTLFIDEGFGTLSGEPLQKAIETLRSLHSRSGRHVGIISHVEELKERIPVQIQVNQEGNNSSSKINITS